MRFAPLILVLGFVAGCASDDARLHGTWKSDREATIAAAFQKNPTLTNLPPDNIQRFRKLYGDLTLTYSNGIATSFFRGKTESWRYYVIQRGDDFVVLRSEVPGLSNTRIHFVDGGKGYWADAGDRYQERFDKIGER
jgi:hypothetical protein